MTNTKKKIVVEVEVPDGATHYEVSYNTIHFFKIENDRCNVPCDADWLPAKMSDAYFKYLKPIKVIE